MIVPEKDQAHRIVERYKGKYMRKCIIEIPNACLIRYSDMNNLRMCLLVTQ